MRSDISVMRTDLVLWAIIVGSCLSFAAAPALAQSKSDAPVVRAGANPVSAEAAPLGTPSTLTRLAMLMIQDEPAMKLQKEPARQVPVLKVSAPFAGATPKSTSLKIAKPVVADDQPVPSFVAVQREKGKPDSPAFVHRTNKAFDADVQEERSRERVSPLARLASLATVQADDAPAQRPRRERQEEKPIFRDPPAGESKTSETEPVATESESVLTESDEKPGLVEDDEEMPAPKMQTPSIQNLLEGVDPAFFNLSGSELEVEVVGDTVLIQGSEEDVAMLEMLITMVDQSTEQKELRVVKVKQRDANEIARTAQEAIRKATAYPNKKSEDEVTITALSSSILLVAALPGEIDFVVHVIEKVDAVPPLIAEFEQMTFMVKNRRASDVAEQLSEVVQKIQERQGASGAEGEVQIIPNDANNSLLIIAAETEREKLQRLIDQIDVEPVKGWGEIKLTLFPLLHSEADELADTINELLATPERRDEAEAMIYRLIVNKADPITGEISDLPPIDLEKTIKIIPDSGINALIVATVEENVEPMGELIRLMDGVPVAEEVNIRLFALEFADAETLKDVLEEMFEQGKDLPEEADGSDVGAVPDGAPGEALSYNIGIVADQRSNTLIVSGRGPQMDLVEQIVSELDKPAVALKFPLTIIPLKHADASRIGQLINDLVEKRIEALENTNADGSAIERERVYLSVDVRTNSLVVSASKENVGEINAMLKQLDVEPATVFQNIRLIACERIKAETIKEKIDELWERKVELNQEFENLEDTPVLVADERSNTLLVASSGEDYDEIKRIIEELEKQPMIESTKLFELEHADAKALAWKLEELFNGLEGISETLESPTVIPDSRSNSLLVAATRDAMERVENLVSRLDVQAGSQTAVFKVYNVMHSAASRLAPKMQKLFDQRAEGEEEESSPIVVMADEASNSIIVSASRDDQSMIAELLELLDKPSSLARQMSIFPLEKASATRVADQLDELFQTNVDGDGLDRADTISMQADERTNSIIVWASATELENIYEVIKKLDTAKSGVTKVVKIIQLKQALAEDFASVLEEALIGDNPGEDNEKAIFVTWEEKRHDGTVIERKMLRQDINVKADQRTNSLMVVAPKESIAMLEALIKDFDRMRPVTNEVRMFPLVNSDAQTMQERLTELFDADGANQDMLTKLTLDAAGGIGDVDWGGVGQDLRFVAEERTNILIAAGSRMDLDIVEELVRYLDSLEVEERISVVVPAKFLPADQIATAVRNYNQQEQDVLGEVDDETSQMRRSERQISIESLEGEEGGSSQLIVGTSRRNYARTMELIKELDRPEPQVAIQVLVAEVQLTNDIELGVEIAGQELDFSRNAVLGPNGIVEGSDFDIVAGTDLGAIGRGQGFNFTVTGEDFSFLLHALQQDSRVEILQRPLLIVRNGGDGEVRIADQIPVVTNTTVSDSGNLQSNVSREEVGIILTTSPRISPDGYVTMEISQEISNFSGENIQLTEGLSQPIISERTVETNVTVRNGDTVVIGGLITTRESEGESKIPLLGDIPYLGVLFRSTQKSYNRTELLVVLTVDILDDAEGMQWISEKQLAQYELSPQIRQSPLMESLRIRAEENPVLGPKGAPAPQPRGEGDRLKRNQRPTPGDAFGPKPKVYGPKIPDGKTITRKSSGKVYGPFVKTEKVAERR